MTAKQATPSNPPKFPCWLWRPSLKAWYHYSNATNQPAIHMTEDTHWHEDQPTAPTEAPGDSAHNLPEGCLNRGSSDAATQPSPAVPAGTPRTDFAARDQDPLTALRKECVQLERELTDSRAEVARLNGLTRWQCSCGGMDSAGSKENERLRAELAEARAEIERLDPGVHSCSDTCQRPMCVLRRELAEERIEHEKCKEDRSAWSKANHRQIGVIQKQRSTLAATEAKLADLHRDWQSEREAHAQAYELAKEDRARLTAQSELADGLAEALRSIVEDYEHVSMKSHGGDRGEAYAATAKAALARHAAAKEGRTWARPPTISPSTINPKIP